MGFGPQLVDFDGDGRQDILSGNWVKQIILFRQQSDGTFSAGEPIRDREGKPIETDYGVTAFACDWDGAGDLDLLAGTTRGQVFLIPNTGTHRQPAYGKPQVLQAAGEEISAPMGEAAPAVADWDADGRPDLLLGTGEGSVLWFRNTGTQQEPKLAAPVVVMPPPDRSSERGERAKICVTDWNGDGRLDLLVGDFGKQFEKDLSGEEQEWRDTARQEQSDLLKQWAETFGEYRKLLTSPKPEDSELLRERDEQLARLRDELQRLKQAREKFYRTEQALQPGKQHHGRVWLFLRRS